MRNKPLNVLFVALLLLSGRPLEAAWFDALTKSISSSSQVRLDQTQIGKGIKEALSLSIDRAVAAASRDGGYLNNDKIKILLPKPLQKMEPLMRKLGLGPKLDDFQKSLNQAAEKAAPAAKTTLLDAVGALTLEDVQKIWKGGDSAATDFFRSKSQTQLRQAFIPIIARSLNRSGVTQKYNQLANAYQALPVPSKPKLVPLEEYAADKALAGLFILMADEEKKIRMDPKARATELLRQVFSSSSKAK